MSRNLSIGAALVSIVLGTFFLPTEAQQTAGSITFDPEYGTGDARTLALDEAEVVYLDKGEGAPVVFYYPGNDYRIWQWQVEAAASHYRVVALSFAPNETGLPFDLLSTAELEAALEALGLGPVHLVAHSISAWQAMALAARRPELFRTLVLEEPAVDLRDAVPECSLEDASEAELRLCLFSSLVHGPGWFERLPDELRRYYVEFEVGAPQSDASGETVDPVETRFPSICDEVARLPMPILFVRGQETPAHFQAKLDVHEACLPEHETISIAGASHSVHVDRPDDYNAAILDFISRHEGQTARSADGTQIDGAALADDGAQSRLDRAVVNGGEIEYAERGAGEPVLLIHGVGLASAFVPVEQQPALADYRLIRMHRRGYAGSSEIAEGRFTMEEQAADAAALLEALGETRAHIVGHSYGTAIALQMAADYPERVRSLVLLDGGPPPGLLAPPEEDPDAPSNPIAEVDRRARNLFEQGDPSGAVESFFSFVFGEDWREYFAAVPGGLAQAIEDAAVTFTIEGRAMNQWQSVRFPIEAVRQPMLVVWGAESPIAAPASQAFVDAVDGAEGRAIEGTDHALITQAPEAVAEVIADFLGRHSESR